MSPDNLLDPSGRSQRQTIARKCIKVYKCPCSQLVAYIWEIENFLFLLSIAYYIFPAHIVSGLIIIAGGHIVARCLIPFVSNRLFINIYIYFYRPLCCCCCRGGRSAMVARRAISFVRPVTWCAAVPCVGDDGRDGRREKYRSDAHCARR